MTTSFKYIISIGHLELEVDVEASFDCTAGYSMYGADADGNRGELTSDAEIINLDIRDNRANPLSKKIKEKYPDQYDEIIMHALDKALDSIERRYA